MSPPAPSRPAPSVAWVFRRHHAAVWRFLRYMGVPEADLHDASQDVFVVVHRRIGDFRGDSRIETWLYGICLRVVSNRRRARDRRPEVPLDSTDAEPADERPRDDCRGEARQLLARALEALDRDQATVFVLSEIEEVPMPEVARVVGCPLFTAYSRRRLARKHLRSAIERLEARDE